MHHLYHLYHRQRHLLLCVLTPLLLAVVSPSTLVARPVAERAISAKTAAFHQPKTTSAASSTASNFEEDLDLRTPENPASTVNGLDYKYYEGFWNALPTFSTLTPTKTGTITSPTLTPAQRDYGYAMQFTGYVTVPTDGSYTFYVNSDDGSRLYLGSTMVVDNDGSHGDRELNGTIGLKAGTHAFTVAYFQNGGGQVLSVSYAGPNISKQLIPTSAYKRVSTAAANKAPVASAGSNQSVTLPTNTVTLNGSGTDADGTINAYMWSQVSGPSTASFNSKSVAAPNVTGLVAGTYLFSLVVADNQGALSEAAQVSVVVSSASGLRTPENPASTVAGLDYKYYEGIWEALPPFSTMTPIKTGTVTAPTLTPQRRDYGYAMQFEGYVTVPTDGQYTFYLNSDDGSRLYLGSTLVVDNDGSHGDREIASVIGLKAGTHALTIGYLQGYGGQNLAVSYAGPGFAKQIIPASAYKRVSTTGANQSPVAVAGTNQSITLPTNTVTLTGSGTDSDGTVASYTWSQVSGPTVATFSSKTTASPSVSGLVAGSYVFSLVVADNQGALSNAAQVTVTVNANNTLRVPENPTGTVAGLNYKYYEGFWDMVPDFSTLTPLKTGASTAFELTPQVRDYGFSFQFTGYITVPTDGQYTFYANSDDGSLLYLGSTLVVNNDGSHGDREIASTIGLKAGTHAFTVAYLQGFGGQNLQISYAGPGFTKRLVPASALSRLSGTAPVNKAPVASAGDAKTITLPTNSLTLSGAGTDADGTISSFLWSQVSGPNTAAFNNNTVAQPVVSGLVAGSYIFSLVVTDNQSMKSAPAQVTITVANGNSCQVASPGVTTPVTYCQGAAANSLSSSVTLASGATLKIYTAATGGTALASDFKPATTTVGSTTYYVSQVSGTCESARAELVVTITTAPGAPTVTSPVTYCQGAAANLLSGSASAASGNTVNIYTASTGGTALAADFRPSTSALGSTTYYAAQASGTCESARTALTVTITSAPGTPNIATSVTYCVGNQSSALSSSVSSPGSGSTQSPPTAASALRIYTGSTGGTALANDFQPSTSATGTTTYYVSQASGSCESARMAVAVNVVSSLPAPVVIPPATVDNANIAGWGDSFTDSQYGLYPATLSQLSGYKVANLGIGGQTSVQIKDRMLADTGKRTWPVIIWAGRNDSDKGAQVKASIAAMVAALPHKQYVVVSVYNGAGESPGTYGYEHIKTLNQDLATIYGSHFMNIRPYTISLYNPNDAQDVADYKNDIPPTSLRSDFLHTNKPGCVAVANYIYAHIDQLFSVNYCQGATSSSLSTNVKMMNGATLKVYTVAAGGTALAADFRPSTTTVGSITYYVSQVLNGCESARTPVTVNVDNCSTTATAGTSSARTSTSSLTTTSAMPTSFDVYPNPFSRNATIDFTFAQAQSYTLELYDSRGYVVKKIASGVAEAGRLTSYQIDGRTLQEGMYVVRLSAGKSSKSFTLTLSK